MRVAIVHDDFIQHGGAERLVLAMLEIFPQADLYSIIATNQWQTEIKAKFNKEVKTSWLQKLPFRTKLFREYYSLYPLAVEAFNLDAYGLVLSSSARYAHGVLTKPGTTHVAYVNSPARFLWQDEFVPKNRLIRSIINWHRAWDKVAAQRPDHIIANSETPAQRIKRYWGREVDTIIYPFVDLARFQNVEGFNQKPGEYFLVVSRLKKWKKIEIAIEACNHLRLSLRIVGRGEDEGRLRSMAGPTIKFMTEVSDEELVSLYRGSRALIMTQAEDFGITALEAQAAGRPVLAYARGGALETVEEGWTGQYFKSQSAASLKEALAAFDERSYLRENCLKSAQRFSQSSFQKRLTDFISHVL